jgi:uncharacterized membrane protein YcjF (UPF0283 family)
MPDEIRDPNRRSPMPRFTTLLVLFLIAIGTSGCEAIATIFEAGIWVGVIIVVIILVVIGALVRMLGGRKR